MPYFVKGLLVVLAFAVTRIIHLIRKHRKGKKYNKDKE